MSAFTTLNIVLEALGSTVGQVKKIKGIQIGRGKKEHCAHFLDGMMFCMENAREYPKAKQD